MDHKSAVRATLFTVAAIAAVGYGVHWWLTNRYIESTDDAYVRADITALTPRVAGEVRVVKVDDFQNVRKGDVLVEIDHTDYAARVASATADLRAAQAALDANTQQLKLQQIAIEQADAEAQVAKADAWRAQSDWARVSKLMQDGVVSKARSDSAQAATQAADATVARADAGKEAARGQIAALQADRKRLQSLVQARAAALHLAQIDLDSTTIRAPIDGTVGDLAVRVGERVTPGEHLMSLVPLQSVYVVANFKETQLTHMAVGQQVRLRADAYPGTTVLGHVENLSPASGAEFSLLPPQNATGNFTKIVQRLPVRIALDLDKDMRGKLRPGMSVVVKVDVHSKVDTAGASKLAGNDLHP
jgi:membrane fusion protein (multidrug efflux system)